MRGGHCVAANCFFRCKEAHRIDDVRASPMHNMPKTGYFAASALPIMRAKVTERPQQLPVDMFGYVCA